MPLSIGPELAAAIDQLYVAFQAYPLPAKTYPCPCCHSVDSDRPLYSRPLRKLRPEDLEQYSRDALLVWGGVDEFRHFLPRIFEITVSAERFSFVDREIIFAHGRRPSRQRCGLFCWSCGEPPWTSLRPTICPVLLRLSPGFVPWPMPIKTYHLTWMNGCRRLRPVPYGTWLRQSTARDCPRRA